MEICPPPKKQLNKLLTPLMLSYGEFASKHGIEPNIELTFFLY